MKVITYQLAYALHRTVDLCIACSDATTLGDECGSLGPVSHGLHQGSCDRCARGTPRAHKAEALNAWRLR